MSKFTDSQGEDWIVDVTVSTVRAVRTALDVDLLSIAQQQQDGEQGLLQRLVADPVLLCDMLYVVCREQADQRGLTSEDFGRRLAGDAIESATVALLDALVAFFPPAQRRPLEVAWTKARAAQAKLGALQLKKVESPEMDALIAREIAKAEAEMDRMLGGQSGYSPESSA